MKHANSGTASPLLKKTGGFLQHNSVILIFLILSILGYFVSGTTPTFFLQEIVTRFTRNAFLALSLIIPIIAGIGLNFAIVIGAIAGQMSILHTISWDFGGFPGFLFALAFSTPIAILFGYLTGKVLNKTKGNEMITSMILGYMANGVYQFIYLLLIGTVIPFPKKEMMLEGGVGLLATCDLSLLKYSLDDLWKTSLGQFAIYVAIFLLLFAVYCIVKGIRTSKKENTRVASSVWAKAVVMVVVALVLIYLAKFNETAAFTLNFVDISISTLIMIGLLCLFNHFIFKTKLGQDFRTVGQSQQVAAVAGINVDRTRTIAIILSTVFAAWGQIINLQNIGTMNTYSNHEQVGLFAVAAILVGGASVVKATNKQAIIGIILFHALMAISPLAGVALFSEEQIGEFFRVFIAYGIIFVSLALNAAKSRKERKQAMAGANEEKPKTENKPEQA